MFVGAFANDRDRGFNACRAGPLHRMTRFLSDRGVGEVVDFMPVQGPHEIRKIHQIVRVVRAVRGSVRFRLDCRPAFDFARRRRTALVGSNSRYRRKVATFPESAPEFQSRL